MPSHASASKVLPAPSHRPTGTHRPTGNHRAVAAAVAAVWPVFLRPLSRFLVLFHDRQTQFSVSIPCHSPRRCCRGPSRGEGPIGTHFMYSAACQPRLSPVPSPALHLFPCVQWPGKLNSLFYPSISRATASAASTAGRECSLLLAVGARSRPSRPTPSPSLGTRLGAR